jgi:hypothetical protein
MNIILIFSQRIFWFWLGETSINGLRVFYWLFSPILNIRNLNWLLRRFQFLMNWLLESLIFYLSLILRRMQILVLFIKLISFQYPLVLFKWVIIIFRIVFKPNLHVFKSSIQITHLSTFLFLFLYPSLFL